MSKAILVAAMLIAPAAQADTVDPVVTLGALCRGDAVAPVVPARHVLRLMAQDWGHMAMAQVGEAGTAYQAYTLPMDLPWAKVLAEAGAAMPAALQPDLPWLMLLADLEGWIGASAGSIAYGTLVPVAPQIEAALLAQGQDTRATLFRELQIALPGAEASYQERSEILAAIYQSGDAFSASSFYQAMENYAYADDLMALVQRLALQDPQMRGLIAARRAEMTEYERLGWLVIRLRAACDWDVYEQTETPEVMPARAAPAPRGILLMQQLLDEMEYGHLSDYLSNPGAKHAPELLAVLEARGLQAEADALRRGMALFPTPWPRDDYARMDLLGEDDNLWERLEAVTLPEDAIPRIEDQVMALAKESGLLPRAR